MATLAALALAGLTPLGADCRAEEALVLSGGGARGLAHAGVVLGVERRGHDPGIVVGTSMGSIVGGLYAAGYTGAEIRAILVQQDWREIFTPFPFEVGPWRDIRYPVVRLDTSTGAAFGTRAAIADWRINRQLVRFLFEPGARAAGNFDRLPRRFRSVAADAETGEMISIGSGDLARAVRASMAAPGFFAPIRWPLPDGRGGDSSGTGRNLTDGGLADYLPVAEARRLGGDWVIASDVMVPNHPLQSGDALAIARRSTELLTVNARREKTPPDVLVIPDIDPGLEEFHYPSEPDPVIEGGLRTALRVVPPAADSATSSAGDSATSPSGPAPGSNRAPRPLPASLASLVIEPASAATPDVRLSGFLRRAFGRAAPGAFRPDQVLAVVDRLYTTGLFDGIWPSVEPADTSAPDAPLVLRVRSEPRPLLSVSGSLGYDNDRGGRIWGAVRRLEALGSVPYDISLSGSANGIEQWGAAEARFTSLWLGASAWTLGASFGESELRFARAEGGNLEVERASVWGGFETRSLRTGLQASVGVRSEQINADFGPEGGSIGPWVRLRRIAPLVEALGGSTEIGAETRFGDVEYRRAWAKGGIAGRWHGVEAALAGDAAVVGGEAPLDAAPSMGGEGMVPGLREGERRGRARAVAGGDLAIHTKPVALLRLRARGGVIADECRPERGIPYSREKLWLAGVRLSGIWWTVFGRLEIGADASTLGDRRAIIDLGTQF